MMKAVGSRSCREATARSQWLVRALVVFIACHFLLSAAWAQPGRYSTENKKAIKLYEEARSCMPMRDKACIEEKLKRSSEADPDFMEAHLLLGEFYETEDRDADAEREYQWAMDKNPLFFPNARFHLAEVQFRLGKYAEAERNYQLFLDLKEASSSLQGRAQLGVESCAFARTAVQQPVPFDPVNLGPNINGSGPEYYPCITADDATLFFTRVVNDENAVQGIQEDFFMSRRGDDGAWGPRSRVPVINTSLNEGAGTLSPDGRFIIFTACELYGDYGPGRRGLGSCDLFISRRIGEKWSLPENMGAPINSRSWESQPSLGSDGRTLYFIRGLNTSEGTRVQDIYVCTLQDDGNWGKPERLPAQVNSEMVEESVQIHPDGTTLYFSSDGHPGMGGLDLYVSRKQPDGTWSEALNLGYPINTSDDENSLLVNALGDIAYFGSDRPGGQGDLDLYSFVVPGPLRPNPVSYIRGKVTDKSSGLPVEADVELYDLATGKLTTGAYSDPKTGEFLVCLPSGKDYALNASADGYLFFSENYSIAKSGTATKPIELPVALNAIGTGQTIALRNIFFNTASAALLPESNAELSKLKRLLDTNVSLKVEVGGHTDNAGDDASNQKLSEQRANAVRDHLIAAGIDATRITAKGYGETKPVADNANEQGRAQNRRTEVTVL
ncbi:MAG: OmpA family protein [Flavobacteriales bacterium]|nr:OmpA family protein [Flavobacteriales bacterium]